MNDAPLVSVIIPVYNGVTFLSDALTSVLQQTYQNFEIVVVDDGSSDGSHALAQKIAGEDCRIKALRQPNGGTQAARNTALHHAAGEWIALLDQDDVWLPKKLESQIALLKAFPCANLLFTNYFSWDGLRDLGPRYTKRHKFPDGDVGANLTRWCLFGASTVMIRRAAAEELGGFDLKFHLSGDWDLWLRLAEKGLLAKGVWEPQVRYRIWSGNESRRTLDMTLEIVGILEKALTRPQSAFRRRTYKRSLQIARGNLEFAQVRPLIETQPKAVPPAALRAWLCCPTRFKWLLWHFATLWPNSPWAEIVYRKIRGRW
ncbi:MAG: glycosyltransferase [Verrucomicrobiota bacterium]|jgi:glycosyltransferase involved in cell wall biosynthesis